MIKTPTKCSAGHTYIVFRPSNYNGKAQYPPGCPRCNR